MSLVGSLQDLGLADILQIVSLSRKSGLLLLRSDSGEGRIVFRDGLVQAAFIKGEPEDLRGLLVGGDFLETEVFDAAAEATRRRGLPLDEAVCEQGGLSHERLESLRREHVERAVLRMFAWRMGEFSFEVSGEIEPRDEELLLSRGVNAQYLTMEATRLGDESPEEARLADETPLFSGEDAGGPEDRGELPAPDPAPPVDPGSDLEAEVVAVEAEPADAEANDLPAPLDAVAASRRPDPGDAREAVALAAASAVPEETPTSAPGLIVIDPELPVLEWLKSALSGLFARVHIFQRTENGIARIRQYLARAQPPVVLISADAPADPVTGVSDLAEFICRLRSQAPRMPILVMREAGRPEPRGADAAAAVVTRPPADELADARQWSRQRGAAARLRETLQPWTAPREPAERGTAAVPDGSQPTLERLRELSHRLRDPAQRGEVLSLALAFAAERFPRVAMFMVRDDEAVGIAQSGLDRTGGPDDRGIRDVCVPIAESAWLARVVAEGNALRGEPGTPGDRRLAARLGAERPAEAYVAPILGGDRVVALLYADTLPGGEPLGDTTAVEIVLHEAGLALDRALLERALEASGEGDGPGL